MIDYKIKKGEYGTSETYIISNSGGFKYLASKLIEEGFAGEIEGDIDIDAIRSEKSMMIEWHGKNSRITTIEDGARIKSGEARFFESYRIVKAVIERLNESEKYGGKFAIAIVAISHGTPFAVRDVTHKMFRYSILPSCHTRESTSCSMPIPKRAPWHGRSLQGGHREPQGSRPGQTVRKVGRHPHSEAARIRAGNGKADEAGRGEAVQIDRASRQQPLPLHRRQVA